MKHKTEHPCKGRSAAQIAAFERVATGREPQATEKTLNALLRDSLIHRGMDKQIGRDRFGPIMVPFYFVPAAIHAQWCAWAAEQPEEKPVAVPLRIQRKRTAGWRLPGNTICVDRSTKLGNPFVVNPRVGPGDHARSGHICVPTVADAIECYRIYLNETRPAAVFDAIEELRGRNLACYCRLCPKHAKGKPLNVNCADCDPCHVDVLGPIVNGFTCEEIAA
jgi:hypothetical protein